jgi:FkbM family methyltransferase
MNLKNIIDNYFSEISKDNLVMLQIGANDGIQNDPFRECIIEYKIKAHLLEPVPELYKMLVDNYSNYEWVNCYNIGITDKNEIRKIKYVPKIEGIPDWTRGLGTFDESKNFLGGFGDYKLQKDYRDTEIYQTIQENIKIIDVKTSKLKNFIIDNKIDKIDIYASDTEGFDWIIFKQLDLTEFSPKIIFMETHTLTDDENNSIISKLIDNDYRILSNDWDTIAIKI